LEDSEDDEKPVKRSKETASSFLTNNYDTPFIKRKPTNSPKKHKKVPNPPKFKDKSRIK
jgi:hypothetical protein